MKRISLSNYLLFNFRTTSYFKSCRCRMAMALLCSLEIWCIPSGFFPFSIYRWLLLLLWLWWSFLHRNLWFSQRLIGGQLGSALALGSCLAWPFLRTRRRHLFGSKSNRGGYWLAFLSISSSKELILRSGSPSWFGCCHHLARSGAHQLLHLRLHHLRGLAASFMLSHN